MRLLKRSPAGNISLDWFDDDHPPPYAILSHTWTTGQEVTYPELMNGTGTHKTGYDKIRFCVDRAAHDGIEYSWVDTCCIDRSTSDELSTAINSMFRWYQQAVKCYVYLSDVNVPEEVDDAEMFRITWDDAFRRSLWFTRGWTLQELLAPATVEFFSKEKKRLGSKISLEKEIHQITKIPVEALRRPCLSEFSIDERMRWAAPRTTTRKEDKAYCLVGIFSVFLPLIYGEGEEYALQRLRDEVLRRQQGSGTQHPQDIAVPSPLPFPRNQLFAGREDQLCSLEKSLLHSDGHQRIAIYGLGGCGKSAIALEFAYRTMSDNAGHLVFWVPAFSYQSFEHAYREIGFRLTVPGITEDNANVKRLVKEALSSNNGRLWLMIVDNADDLDILMRRAGDRPESERLYDYLPYSDNGKILFTTRSRNVAESLCPSNVLELQDMGKVEAKQLFSRRITKKLLLQDDECVTELIEALTYLPLAIVQAAAFINNNDVSLSDYISMLHETGTNAELFGEHFEDHTRYQEMDRTIAKTWYVSFNQIRRQDPLAEQYLSFIACVERTNIPQSMLPLAGSRLRHLKAIGTLKGYAFISERQQTLQEIESERFFDMHRLVHMASAWWLDDEDNRTIWTAKVAARLAELIPYEENDTRKAWTNYLLHGLHVAEGEGGLDQLVRASLFARVGGCQTSLGHYAAATVSQTRALRIRETVLGSKHPDTLSSMNSLASVLVKQGKYEEAEAICRQTLAQRETVLGPKHHDTLMSMNNLAFVLEKQGKYEEAEAMYRETLAQAETVLGPKHPDSLIIMNNLASVLSRQGKYEEAEAMYRGTLAQVETALGLKHPDTLSSMNNLAIGLSRQGKNEEAEAMYMETLAQRKTVLGPKHPDTLTNMNNLASVLYRQGKYEEAEAMYRQTLAQRETALGPKHPDTLMSINNLASVLDDQGKYEEAEAMYRETLAQAETVLGPKHPDTLMSMNNFASVLGNQGKYEEAEAICRQTLAQRKTVLGPKHHDTLMSMNNLASVLGRQGKNEEAEAMYRGTLAQVETALGPKHPDTLISMNNLAVVLGRQGKYEEAEAMNREMLAQAEIVLGPKHPNTLISMNNLVIVLYRQGKYEEAEAMYRQTLA